MNFFAHAGHNPLEDMIDPTTSVIGGAILIFIAVCLFIYWKQT